MAAYFVRRASLICNTVIDGVIGVSMDVTELKDREADLQTQERENSRLLANEAVSGNNSSFHVMDRLQNRAFKF